MAVRTNDVTAAVAVFESGYTVTQVPSPLRRFAAIGARFRLQISGKGTLGLAVSVFIKEVANIQEVAIVFSS